MKIKLPLLNNAFIFITIVYKLFRRIQKRNNGKMHGRRRRHRAREGKRERKSRKKEKARGIIIQEYKKIITEERSEYLSKKMKMRDRKTIARFRCGNEVREREYWKTEEEKVCGICEKKTESLWHVVKECEGTRQEEELEKVLRENEQGLKILRSIEEERKSKGGGTEKKRKIEDKKIGQNLIYILYCSVFQLV